MSGISELVEEYARGASLLRRVLQFDRPVDLDARPIAGKWSIREVVCHLADSEMIYADRIKRVLAEHNPTFFAADPNQFRLALLCERRPVERELAVVEAVRAHLHPILQACDSEAFQRTGVHSRDGSLTLLALVERVTGHIPHHLAFIEEKLQAMRG